MSETVRAVGELRLRREQLEHVEAGVSAADDSGPFVHEGRVALFDVDQLAQLGRGGSVEGNARSGRARDCRATVSATLRSSAGAAWVATASVR